MENYRNYRAQIDDLNISYLNLRRFEQHFLLRYSEDPAFFTTGENVYIKKHEAASEKFTEIIKELQNNEITSELNLNDNYLNISNYKDAYATIFQELVKKTFARGSEHAGIIGEMNNSSNACIELADNKILKDYSSRMQAQSRAYLSTRDLSFYTDFLYSFTELSDLLSGENPKNAILPVDSSTMVLDLETDSVRIEKSLFVSKEFSEHINNFKTKFIALRKVDKQLGITYKKGLEGKIRDEIHKIDPQMEQIVKHTAEAHALSMKGIKKSVYLFIIGFGALLIILIWQFSRSISMPLKRLYKYI
ncbi:MAG: hypothetical protein U9N85_12230, partial [Bacteroidota bacterium]|nr:hypothetical protein [Bacteroidota bacterium]